MTGIKDLLACKRFWFCSLILAVSAPALYLKDLDSTSFAAIVSSIVLIYNYTSHKIDLQQSINMPPKGTL